MLKKFTAMILTVVMLLSLSAYSSPASADELPFTDVKDDAWYYDAVKYVYDIGIMNGTGNGTVFSPDVTVTRSMFVAMLGRLHGAEQKTTDKFPDVDNVGGSWYAGYVGWASETGIITGYDNGNFGPNDPVTREQMAVIIMRYVKYIGIVPKKSSTAPAYFTDIDSVGDWAVSFVEQMRQIGIVQGNAMGQFDPKGGLGRSSAATIIMRLDKMIKELTLGEAINPDYTLNNGAFALMGAWDLYYGGTALDSSYDGIGVKTDGGYPYITADQDGQKWIIAATSGREYYEEAGVGDPTFGEEKETNTLAKDTFFEIDMKIACIDPAKYPVLRFAYRTKDSKELKFGVYADSADAEYLPFTAKDEKISGWSYGIVDITGEWNEGAEKVIATVSSKSDAEFLYFAAFPDKASAEAFDITSYKNEVAEYDGAVAEIKTASKADVDAALAEAYAKADAILNATDDIDPATIPGTCYYISSTEGDDANDGLSPETPWRTFNNLYIKKGTFTLSKAEPGDAVFLKRGDVFNSSAEGMGYLDMAPGVTYSPYGEGAKPVISRELIMDEPAGKWVETEYENVWKLDYEIMDNPGNISFVKSDGTELWGIFTFPMDYNDLTNGKTRYYGTVTNGEDTFVSGGIEFKNVGCLKNNLEYFGDKVNGGLYVYYDRGNPGEVFDEIHISLSTGQLVGYFGSKTGVTTPTRFHNMSLKYGGGCGIGTGEAENIYITGCDFEWIGGAYQGIDARFGNAIQNWGHCDGMFVIDCYFKDIYDAAVSTQGNFGIMRNFYSSGCVLDRCDLPYEFFNHGAEGDDADYESELVNLFLTDNYILNTGVGYCNVRHDRRGAFLYTTYGTNDTKYENIVYENNVNIFTSEYGIFCGEVALGKTEGTILRNNTYYIDPDAAYFGKFIYNMIDRTGLTRTLFPYNSQYLTYLNSIGVEVGSTFYFAENPDPAGNR